MGEEVEVQHITPSQILHIVLCKIKIKSTESAVFLIQLYSYKKRKVLPMS